jgi:hypothetical protein
MQSPANPQNLNRYAYCANNPLSAIDPNGKDYIFVCGSGGMPEEWNTMMGALNIDRNKEQVWIIYEAPGAPNFGGSIWSGGFEIEDQVAGLEYLLSHENLTDIKLIGHSEGAAAIITVLDKLSQTGGNMGGKNIGDELKAAVTIEAPTTSLLGIEADWCVSGWNQDRYNDLPKELGGKFPGLQLLDIWNENSLAHSAGPMPGWSTINTYSYGSFYLWPWNWCFIPGAHNDPLTNHEVIEKIQETINS